MVGVTVKGNNLMSLRDAWVIHVLSILQKVTTFLTCCLFQWMKYTDLRWGLLLKGYVK